MAQRSDQQHLTESPLKQVATKYFLSCTAALVAETVTYPLDITKTRLQIARNQHTKGGMFQVTYDIVRKEGPLSLWSGVGPAITRHYIYTGIRMGGYETLRGMVFDEAKEKSFPVWKSMLCGATAGLVAQFAASPTDLVKVQMQMEGLRKLQKLPLRYSGAFDCFISLYRTQGMWSILVSIFAFSTCIFYPGFFGLWLGWIPNCQRAALLNMADIATYDFVKHKLLAKFNLPVSFLRFASSPFYFCVFYHLVSHSIFCSSFPFFW
ncbi:hypothetical protein ANCDUO_18089 [Ancylostoma duodenale]|uniref:Uncharacterized protein n=1 Tax=Ancylostoma duodenale TaxID=51022 RepID=A0A0C2C6B3_9BILA|nr:hypothetical protein ANCDUO_18089 [Ancylostoma duodenale]